MINTRKRNFKHELDLLYDDIMSAGDNDRKSVDKNAIDEAFKRAYRRDEIWNLQLKLKR